MSVPAPDRRPLWLRLCVWLTGLLFAFASTACSNPADDVLSCTVGSVHDGDSMRVRCPGSRQTIRVRLHQIDAPELQQAYGRPAGDALRQLCPVGREVRIAVQGEDQYGRLLGDVECAGKNINHEMVSSGAAWAYTRYVQDAALPRLQDQARQARRGLWAQANPEPPWQWRQRQRQAE